MDIPPDRTPLAGVISDANPMGTDGFEFVEFTGPDLPALEALFTRLGFQAVAHHRSKQVTLWRQGDVNFILNAEPESFAQAFQRVHGPCACAMAFRVADAAAAYKRAIELGAKPVLGSVGPMELNIPAIEGIGGSLLYFVDRYGARGSIYDVDFRWVEGVDAKPQGNGLTVHRPPDPQRASRPHGCLVGLLRQALQFPRDPLLRHRGQADRAEVARPDLPLRPDPHPDQREQRRQVADRGIPARLWRRGHPAHRPRHRRHLCQRRGHAGGRHRVHGHAGHLLRAVAEADAGPAPRRSRGSPATAS